MWLPQFRNILLEIREDTDSMPSFEPIAPFLT